MPWGCQVLIVKAIIEQGADYVLAVKNNQQELYENIVDEFRFMKNPQFSKQYELDHGRIETRTCTVINDFQFIENQSKWKNL
jgi:predicted transposase YbfD/YdcC